MICIQIGQCGIQIGSLLEPLLPHIQILLIDTESKVISNPSHTSIRLDSIGRGNNWAHGFSEPRIDDIISLVESMNTSNGFLLIHSLAGGTGSGLGSRLTSELRDGFPKSPIMNIVICPISRGETMLQHYNFVLALNAITRSSDSIALISNGVILDTLKPKTKGRSEERVSMHALNTHIASLIASQLKDVKIWDFVTNVTPIPSMNTCLFFKSASTDETWADRMNTIVRAAPIGPRCTLAAFLIFRNWDPKDTYCMSFEMNGMQRFKDRFKCLMPPVIKYVPPYKPSIRNSNVNIVNSKLGNLKLNIPRQNTNGSSNPSVKEPSSISACLNSTDMLNIVEPEIQRAKEMYAVGAYVHWYERYLGAESGVFEDAFEGMENLVQNYRELL